MAKDRIYLDYAAATPVDPAVLAVMQPYFSEHFYNPSATYQAARESRDALEVARADIAHWLGARPSEIIFTAGGTEANNLAIHGLLRQYPDSHGVVSALEHESVLEPASQYDHSVLSIEPDGRLNIDALRAAIKDTTVLISVMYANNEIGVVQPIREAAQLVEAIRAERRAAGNVLPLYLHTDACQAANYLDLHVARLGVDLMTINGGKIYGPKQSGALYVKAGLDITPLITGGGQERGLRSGTENVPAAVGLAAALQQAQTVRHDEAQRVAELQHSFIKQLEQAFPQAVINGSRKYRLPNNIHVTFPGADNERMIFALDEQGIMAAAGSACSASNEEPSHVLRALGLSDEAAQASLRLTFGRETTADQLETVIKVLKSVVGQ